MNKAMTGQKEAPADRALLAEMDLLLRQIRQHRRHIERTAPRIARLRESTAAVIRRIQTMCAQIG
ncbi:MAG: hypothetical protein ACKVYV_16445 [Limisphaerales bacterium]